MRNEKEAGNPVIGVMIELMYPQYYCTILSGIEEEARRRNANLLIFIGNIINIKDPVKKSFNEIYQMIDNPLIDYLIIFPHVLDALDKKESMAFLRQMEPIPLVTIGSQLTGYNAIVLDNKTGFRQLITHIIVEHGKKKLAFIKGPDNNYDSAERFEVFTETLSAHNLPLMEKLIIRNNYFMPESGKKAIRILIEERKLKPGLDFDAIVACNDGLALGATEGLMECYQKVPDGLAVCGFDNSNWGWYADNPLSTVHQPVKLLGQEAVKLLLVDKPAAPLVKYIPTQCIIRKSCGCNQRDSQFIELITELKPAINEVVDLAAYREKLRLRLNAIIQFTGHKALGEQLTSTAIDSFLALLAGGSEETFLFNMKTVFAATADSSEAVSSWNDALTVMRNFLLAASLPRHRELAIGQTLDQAHGLISILLSRMEIFGRYQYEIDIGTIRNAEERIKTTFGYEQLITEVMDGFLNLGFEDIYLFLYQTMALHSRYFKLILSCTNRVRDSLNRENSDYEDLQAVMDRLLAIKMPYIYCIKPVVYNETAFGFIILNKNPLGSRLVYDDLTSQIGAAVKGFSLLDETQRAYARVKTLQEELQAEIAVAAKIQLSMLPDTLAHNEFDIAARMITAVSVGGDYYDWIHTAGKDWIVIGDVSGHGVHSGLVMMMVRNSIHLLLKENPALTPQELLTKVNAAIIGIITKLGESKYVTIAVLSYDGGGAFTFSGMHLPLLIYRQKSGIIEWIDMNGIWLGIVENIEGLNKDSSFSLEKGDCLLLYTDGLTEAENKLQPRQLYGVKRLSAVLQRAGNKPAVEIIEEIIADLRDFIRDDDITLMALKRL